MNRPRTSQTDSIPSGRVLKEEIQRQAHRLTEHALLRPLLDAMPNIVLILNQEGQTVYANRATLELLDLEEEHLVLGLPYGEVLGCVYTFETAGGCGTTEFCRTCGAARAIESSQRGHAATEEWLVTRQQDEDIDALVFRTWTTPVEINGERFAIFACVDISAEKRRRALERIFFHDILNTAGMLLGTIKLMNEVDSDVAMEFEQKARRLTRRLVDEIEAQRDLAEAENYELSVDLVKICSLEFLQQIGDMYMERRVAEGRYIHVADNAQNVTFISDPNLLRRVIENMVKNALEASQPGQKVTLGCKAVGEEIEFWVHNAAFMPKEVQLQIFQRAFSTKGPGRGLGTYSMKLLSQRYLQGDVSFASSEKEGTTFSVRYPLVGPRNAS